MSKVFPVFHMVVSVLLWWQVIRFLISKYPLLATVRNTVLGYVDSWSDSVRPLFGNFVVSWVITGNANFHHTIEVFSFFFCCFGFMQSAIEIKLLQLYYILYCILLLCEVVLVLWYCTVNDSSAHGMFFSIAIFFWTGIAVLEDDKASKNFSDDSIQRADRFSWISRAWIVIVWHFQQLRL